MLPACYGSMEAIRSKGLKTIYCLTITQGALRLIRSYDGDISERVATLCNFSSVEPSTDKYGHVVEDAFRVTYPNGKAICYNLGGAISLA